MSETIAFLDFETTGLSVDSGDRPTEVAVVITRDRQIFELMLRLQSTKIASSADVIRDYARRSGLAIASTRPTSRKNERVATSWAQAQCMTCEGKGRIQTKYVKRWLKCPDCRTAQ